MRLGQLWRGFDGTDYRVVVPGEVKPQQPRWWIDQPVTDGDSMLGPRTPARLHTLSIRKCVRNPADIRMALVLP